MPSTSARSSSRSGLSLYSVPSNLTVTVFSNGSASRGWSLLRASSVDSPPTSTLPTLTPSAIWSEFARSTAYAATASTSSAPTAAAKAIWALRPMR